MIGTFKNGWRNWLVQLFNVYILDYTNDIKRIIFYFSWICLAECLPRGVGIPFSTFPSIVSHPVSLNADSFIITDFFQSLLFESLCPAGIPRHKP